MRKIIILGLVLLFILPMVSAAKDVTVECYDVQHGLVNHKVTCDVTALKNNVNYRPIINITSVPDSYDHTIKLLTDEIIYEKEAVCSYTTEYANGTWNNVQQCNDVSKPKDSKRFKRVGSGTFKYKKDGRELKAVDTFRIDSGETLTFLFEWRTLLDSTWSSIGDWHINPATWFNTSCLKRTNQTMPAFIDTGGYIIYPFTISKSSGINVTNMYIMNSTGQSEIYGVTGQNNTDWFIKSVLSTGAGGGDMHIYYDCSGDSQTNTTYLNNTYSPGVLELYYPMDRGEGTYIYNYGKRQMNNSIAEYGHPISVWTTSNCYDGVCMNFNDDNVTFDVKPDQIDIDGDKISVMLTYQTAGAGVGLISFWQPTGADVFALRKGATYLDGQLNSGGGAVSITNTGYKAQTGKPVLLGFTFDSGTYQWYQNNTAEYTGSIAATMRTMQTDGTHINRKFYLGAGNPTSNFWNGQLDNFFLITNHAFTIDEMTNYHGVMNNSFGMILGAEESQSSISLTVDATSPANSFNTSSTSIDFSCNITSVDEEIDNATLWIWNSATSLNETDTTANQPAETDSYNATWTKELDDGSYIWNCLAAGNTTIDWGTNKTVNVDTIAPTLSLLKPVINFTSKWLPINISFNYTAEDLSLDTCWYNTSWNATLTEKVCNQQINLTIGSSEGGQNFINYYANDSSGRESSGTAEFFFFYIEDNATSTEPITEGGLSSHTLYLNMTNIIDYGVEAWLVWNGTSQSSPTRTNISDDSLRYDLSFTTPTVDAEFINWTWYYNISTSPSVNDWNVTGSQTYISLNISDCNPGDYVILNYTLFDEGSREVPTPATNASIKVDLSLTSYSDPTFNVTFSNEKLNVNNYQVCLPNNSLNTTSYRLDAVARYNYQDHVVEYHYVEGFNISVGVVPDEINLYDLATADSTSFLINYKNSYYRAVEGAIVQVWRYYVEDSEFVPVEMGKTDAGGQTVAHLVTEDEIYKFLVFLNGTLQYESEQSLALCQATPCLIDLRQRRSIEELTSIIDNLIYDYVPDPSNRQATFTWTTTDGSSTTMNMTIFNFNLTESVFSQETTASGGSITGTVPLGFGNQTYFVHIYRDGQLFGTDSLDLDLTAYDVFGYTGIILSAFSFLMLALMAVSSGIGVVIFGIVGLSFLGMLNLFQTGSVFGMASSFIWIIIAGGIIIWKVSKRQVQ